MEPTAIIGDTSPKGLIGRFLSWIGGFLPFGIGAAGVTYLLNSKGGESMLKKLEDIPLIGQISQVLGDLAKKAMDFVRGFFAKEELEADKGLKAQFEASPALREAAQAVGGTETQRTELLADLKKIVDSRISSDTGFSMAEDAEYAKQAATDLRKELSDRILKSFKEAKPEWNEDDLKGYQEKADRIADAISGASQLNTNTADQGYLGALLQAQKAVAAEGKMDASLVKPINIPDSIAQLAAAAAPKDVTPAPEGGAPTTGTKPPAPRGAEAAV